MRAGTRRRGRRSGRARTVTSVVTRTVTVAVAIAVLAGLGVVGARWRSNLRVFGVSGGGSAGTVISGRTITLWSDITPRASMRLDLDSVRPVVTRNTAAATVSVLVCAVRPGTAPVTALDVRSTRCLSLAPVRPGSQILGAGVNELFVAITPHRPGVVTVRGCRVRYGKGLRRGDQVTGNYLIVHSIGLSPRR